jgi:hypothetical protein
MMMKYGSTLFLLFFLWIGNSYTFVQAQADNAQATLQNCAIRINQVGSNTNLRLEKSEFDTLVNVELGGYNSDLVESISYNFACPQCDVTRRIIILRIEGPSATGVMEHPFKDVPHDQSKIRSRQRTREEQESKG